MLPAVSAVNWVPSSIGTVSGSVSVAGVVASVQMLHGQTPGVGSGWAVVNDHVVGAAMAFPAVSAAVTLAV